MASHRAGIAETEVDVTMSVDVVKVRSLGLADERRERSGPLHHPVHGHTREQRLLAAFEKSFRFRTLIDEALLLALHEGLKAGAVWEGHGFTGKRKTSRKSFRRRGDQNLYHGGHGVHGGHSAACLRELRDLCG